MIGRTSYVVICVAESSADTYYKRKIQFVSYWERGLPYPPDVLLATDSLPNAKSILPCRKFIAISTTHIRFPILDIPAIKFE